MKRKGQAAMEFLMTYGWAILAAIIVIGVLAIYFRPSSLTTEQVVVTAPWYGVGATVSASTVQVEIRNNGGEQLDLVLTATTLSVGSCAAPTASVDPVPAGAVSLITFGTCTIPVGSVNADITISYIRPGSTLTLASTGTVSGTV